MNDGIYAVILNAQGVDLLQKIDPSSLRQANDLDYIASIGFSVQDGAFAYLQLFQPDGPLLQIQIPIYCVIGTVFMGGNKRLAGFSTN